MQSFLWMVTQRKWRGVMGVGGQNESWRVIQGCLVSTLVHLTFNPGYSLTVASEINTIYLHCSHENRNIVHSVYHRKSEHAVVAMLSMIGSSIKKVKTNV